MKKIPQSDPKLPAGTNRCQCGSCNAYFGGVRAFEVHRVGPPDNRRCLVPASASDRHGRPLFKLDRNGYWVQTRNGFNKPGIQPKAQRVVLTAVFRP